MDDSVHQLEKQVERPAPIERHKGLGRGQLTNLLALSLILYLHQIGPGANRAQIGWFAQPDNYHPKGIKLPWLSC